MAGHSEFGNDKSVHRKRGEAKKKCQSTFELLHAGAGDARFGASRGCDHLTDSRLTSFFPRKDFQGSLRNE